MRKIVLTTVFAAAFTVGAFNAEAHPGSKILTYLGSSERTAMTPGVSYEDIKGVHVFRGKAALLGDAPAPGPQIRRQRIEIEIITRQRPWRSFRRLRTQGFYSGIPYPSRRYTQGFYSGD